MTDLYQKVREGHRFGLLERGFQSATERNSFHTSVAVDARGVIIAFILYLAKFYYGGLIYN
jgi:hypothetical protein